MIRINGQEVYTPPGHKIHYALVNPYLVYDSVPGNQAQLPALPAVRHNRAIFSYYEEPQAGAYLPELEFQHFYGGELIREGYLILTEASEMGGYKGTYTDRLGLFFGAYQNLSMQEIDFGTIEAPTPLPVVIVDEGMICVCFPTILNEAFYGTNGASVSYSGRVNDYQAGAYVTGPKVPHFGVAWILKKMAELTDTTVDGDFFEHPEWSQLVLANMRAWEAGPIDISNHLPPWTIGQFLLELRKVPNLKLSFNPVKKHLRIDFWENDLLAETTRNWTGRALLGETKTPEPNNRIQLVMAVDGSDALAKDKPVPLADYISPEVPGGKNGIAKVEMKFSTLLTDTGTGLAMCRQEGQTSQFAQDAKTWDPRLLFWHGLVGGVPKATNTLGDYSLFPAVLATTTWKETIALRKRMFYLQKSLVLSETDLARLDFAKKIHIEGVDYLLAQLNITVPIRDKATALLIGGV
ncbi:hypothetical protein [Salmonirosea aquatica]|uniref:Uncharacterized protein n=1 Tax=Salmonirosea aquatica TaxID=2654236 RepID=A0A7C9FTC0_9BACT|nr:hypothetical protein [Cytophagaceae bacterium SJW1-29]